MKMQAPWPFRRAVLHIGSPTVSDTEKSAQVEPAKKAAALKAKNDAKAQQKPWLRTASLSVPREDGAPSAPERLRASDRPRGPPRLLDRHEVCVLAGASYPTVWQWMRAGTFPRSRIVGGKSMWLSTEIEAWMAALPVRRLKGDAS
jgi:predicted DNA-binding transcriptional regulator AlpA